MKTSLRIIFAVLTGVLVCFSFPTLIFGWHAPEMGWIAWVALVPLILAIRDVAPSRAFLITSLAALVWYSGSVFWVYRAMNTFGGLSPATSVMVLILLVLIISAYISFAPMLARLIQTRWRGELIVLLPVCWVAMEICRNYFPCNGFSWSNIAMSQWRLLPIIQIADVVGVYGLIFLIVWVNVFIAEVIARLMGDDVEQLFAKGAMTIILILVTLGYGFIRMNSIADAMADTPVIRVGMIQGNIPQEDKWEEGMAEQNLNEQRKLARQLRNAPVDLIIWPEAAFPWVIKTDVTDMDPVILGLDEDEFGKLPFTLLGNVAAADDHELYNSATLLDAKGQVVGRYHKTHLVPFGEYIPYKKLLFFARKLTRPVGNFLAGTSFAPLSAGRANAGVLICYEDIFPEISREAVRRGAGFLANLTNDAWYGVSSAPYQHLAISVFRAVENRRYLLRATNTGVSAVISPTGKLLVESGLFQQATIVAPVAIMSATSTYTRTGDWFAYACLLYACFGVIMVVLVKCRERFKRVIKI